MKKSFIAYVSPEWNLHFAWREHHAKGFNELTYPDTRENCMPYNFGTKVRITIEEVE